MNEGRKEQNPEASALPSEPFLKAVIILQWSSCWSSVTAVQARNMGLDLGPLGFSIPECSSEISLRICHRAEAAGLVEAVLS
jgi:hypothetical protein